MNKILSTIALLTLSLATLSTANEKNAIQQAMETMNDSKILYNLNQLKNPIPVPDRSGYLNPSAYQVKTTKGISYKAFAPEGEAKKVFHAAEQDFESYKFSAAREKYKKVLQIDPSQTWMMTFIAQTYGIEKKYNEAESWYKKSINANHIDYLAHWLLADIYFIKGEKEKALSEISVAKVLNRNNPKLESKRKTIYAANGLDSTSWTFNPQVRIEKTPNKVTITADTVWNIYAMVKTAWEVEPGYRENKMKTAKRSDLETVECIEGLLLPNEKKKGIPVIDRLNKALDANKFSYFLFYEIELLDHPDLALLLDKKQIQELADYIIFMARK